MKKNKIFNFMILPLLLTSSSIAITWTFPNDKGNNYLKTSKEFEEILQYGEIKDVSLGEETSAAIVTDPLGKDHLFTWGSNLYGQLGDGTILNRTAPIEITSLPEYERLIDVELGKNSSSVLLERENGEIQLYMWGNNSSSQLGNSLNNIVLSPKIFYSVPENWNIVDYEVDAISSIAILEDEKGNQHFYTWGTNANGILGNEEGSKFETTSPIEITDKFVSGAKFSNLSMNNVHAGVVAKDNLGNEHIYGWGYNEFGQVGNDETYSVYSPTDITDKFEEGEVKHYSLGASTSSLVMENSNGDEVLYTWGSNSFGELGTGEIGTYVSTPTKVSTLDNSEVKDIKGGEGFFVAIVTDEFENDSIYTWGNNEYGQLGNGKTSNFVSSPTKISIESDYLEINSIEVGSAYTGIVTKEEANQDHLYMWGYNHSGEIGIGSSSEIQNSPVDIELLFSDETSVKTIFTGEISNTEFGFKVVVPSISDFDPKFVNVYNSYGINVGEVELVNQLTNGDSSVTYTFKTKITDLKNADSNFMNWSVDGGNTLNLISYNYVFIDPTIPEKPLLPNDSNNILIYSIIAISSIIFLILILWFFMMWSKRKNDSDEDKQKRKEIDRVLNEI